MRYDGRRPFVDIKRIIGAIALNREEIEKILRHTLSDFRVSRGERRVIRQVLLELGVDDHDLALLRSIAFDLARETIDDGARDVLDWLEDINKLFVEPPLEDAVKADEVFFTPGDDGPRKIVSLFDLASKTVEIAVFTITDDRVADAIVNAHRRDVAIRIVSDNDKALDRGSDIESLKRRGVSVRVDQSEHHMHHKFAVFDNATTLTGSYNWTRSAARHNAENFVVSHDPRLARLFADEFARLWKRAN
jgi:phosphatidylserine/phosphatidylglycerophosphate/cardiolipin synthase-like enzyme